MCVRQIIIHQDKQSSNKTAFLTLFLCIWCVSVICSALIVFVAIALSMITRGRILLRRRFKVLIYFPSLDNCGALASQFGDATNAFVVWRICWCVKRRVCARLWLCLCVISLRELASTRKWSIWLAHFGWEWFIRTYLSIRSFQFQFDHNFTSDQTHIGWHSIFDAAHPLSVRLFAHRTY